MLKFVEEFIVGFEIYYLFDIILGARWSNIHRKLCLMKCIAEFSGSNIFFGGGVDIAETNLNI